MQAFLRRALSTWLAFVLVFTQSGYNFVLAQTVPDIQAPIIEIEAVLEADAGATQAFTALVADDNTLKDVTLYHRRAGIQAFERANMLPLNTTGFYSVELDTDPTDYRTIEYYVQARDEGGNRTVSGFAFDPYQRVINPIDTAATAQVISRPTVTSVEAAPEVESASRIKWWAVALGVLLVGAVAASGGGSGGSSDDPGRTELTINLPTPQ